MKTKAGVLMLALLTGCAAEPEVTPRQESVSVDPQVLNQIREKLTASDPSVQSKALDHIAKNPELAEVFEKQISHLADNATDGKVKRKAQALK